MKKSASNYIMATFPLLMLLLSSLLQVHGQEIKVLCAFYFGNSLTGNTMPMWHRELGQSVGKEWVAEWWLGAGWQLWQHREELEAGQRLFDGENGEITVPPELIKAASFNARRFYNGKWDVVVLQLFSPYLSYVTDEMWGRKLSYRKDVGDLRAAADIIRLALSLNPNMRVFIYQVWAPMPPGKIPPKEQLPEWAKRMEKLREAEFPDREKFDYEKAWLQRYSMDKRPWEGEHGPLHRTRDFSYQVFEGLMKRYPRLWREGRLRMIPAGDLFLELDKASRQGKIHGVNDIRDFYTDVQHIRFGLPRFTVAALFYACLFKEHPGKLNWQIYNDRDRYGDDPHHDGGELLPITHQNAQAVCEIIWETVTKHPYTGVEWK